MANSGASSNLGNKFPSQQPPFPVHPQPQKPLLMNPHFRGTVIATNQRQPAPYNQHQNFAHHGGYSQGSSHHMSGGPPTLMPYDRHPEYPPQQPFHMQQNHHYGRPHHAPPPIWQTSSQETHPPPASYSNPPPQLNYSEPMGSYHNYYNYQNTSFTPPQNANYDRPRTTVHHHHAPAGFSQTSQTTHFQHREQKDNDGNVNPQQPMDVQIEKVAVLDLGIIKNQDESGNDGNVSPQQPLEVQSEKEAVPDPLAIKIPDESITDSFSKNVVEMSIDIPPDEDVNKMSCDEDINEVSRDEQSTAGIQKNIEVPIVQDAPQNVVTVEEPAKDLSSESLNTDGVQIIQSSVTTDTDVQDKDSEPLNNKEVEIIEEARPSVVVESISIDSSDLSNEDEFENIIAGVVEEAFVDHDSVKGKETDEPEKSSTTDAHKDYDSDSSNDDEFEKIIESAVQEAFQDNDASSSSMKEKNNEEKADDAADTEAPHSVGMEGISQDQITESFSKNVVEMSIDIPPNEDVNEVSRDEMVRPFSRKKVKVEHPEPKPSGSASVVPPQEENWEGDYRFSFTVSYYDSKDKQNCANYVESMKRLYISRDFEFQVLCSAAGVPQGSVLRATPHFLAPNMADRVVSGCKVHRGQGYSKGRQNVHHVLQSTHEGAKYERDEESGRFSVLIPYQCSQGPFQGCAELSCYTYKFTCWSSCFTKVKQTFKVHFTLEKDGLQLGRQILEVKVCKRPERDINEDILFPTPISCSGMLRNFLIPALKSEKYGDLLHWGTECGVFYIKWTHKARNEWTVDELAVFKDWDAFKGREEALTDSEAVYSKQRVRAALRNSKEIKELECEKKGYKKYVITNQKYFTPTQSNVSKKGRATRNPKKAPISPKSSERRTSRKVEPIAYEEAADDIISDEDDPDYGNPVAPPPAKKMKLLPSPNAKTRRRRPAFSNRRRKFHKSPKKKIPTDRLPTKMTAGQKFEFEDGSKNKSLLPSVVLKQLTLQDLLEAGAKQEAIEYFTQKSKDHTNKKNQSVPVPKSTIKKLSNKIKKRPAASTDVEPSPEAPPTEPNVFAEQRINFEATPYQAPPPVPSPLAVLNWKEEKSPPTQMLNTYSNIKTQGDMILAMIRAVLPSLSSDKVSQLYDFLADMGVENAGDLAFIEEDDLNRILKPIQSRKLIAAWKNKGVPSHSISVPRRTEPVTFVPAVFQIQNMASQNQMGQGTPQVFSPPSENPVMQIPGWRQSTAAPPSMQDIYPELGSAKNEAKSPAKVSPQPLPPPPPKEPAKTDWCKKQTETDWTDSFVIPWDKLPSAIRNCLKMKQRPSRTSRAKITGTICSEIFRVAECPTSSELKTIAQKVCDRFPESLCDEGKPGNECHNMYRQLKGRISKLRKTSRNGKMSEMSEEYQKLWLSDSHGKKLDTDSNSKSSASSIPSVMPNTPSMLSSNSYISSGQSHISLTASDKPSTSSTLSDNASAGSNFEVPWHKVDIDILNVLYNGMKLSVLQRLNLTRIICREFHQTNPHPLNKSEQLRMVAEQMRKKFPASLSNHAFKKPGGKLSSSYLAQILRVRLHNSQRDQSKLAKKERERKKKMKAVPAESDSSGILDWAINFRIPWEKMPTNLLGCLKRRERLTPTLRQEMVRVICSDIQAIEQNPNKESVDFIAKKVCKTYPKSLCDMSGDRVGTSHGFLGRQLLWRVQRVNSAVKRKESLPNEFAECDDTDPFVDVVGMGDVATDRDTSMYYDRVEVNKNLGGSTATYSRNANASAGYGGASTSAFYDGGNNFTPLNYLTQVEQLIKKEVSEQDTDFSARMQEEFQLGRLDER